MKHLHFIRLVLVAALLCALDTPATAQQPAVTDTSQSYTVFMRSRAIGQETVAVVQQPDGWLIRGSNRLGPPLDVVTRIAEIHYDAEWRPTRLFLSGTSRGQDLSLKSSFANGQAVTEIATVGAPSTKTDAITADTVVLPNTFLGSYAALARRLVGQSVGKTFRGYIAPQGEVSLRLDGVFAERIETPSQAIAATRYALIVSNPPPAGDLHVSVWADARGSLLRMSVPAQMLELAREDIASAATRTTSFSLPDDETVRIPAAGFGLGASVTKPATSKGPFPAVVLVGGSGQADRDGVVAGIPVLGQLAGAMVDAGFLVVRYDKRGVGQSGGRAETTTISDYADDVRAIVRWLEREREDVDEDRIGLVGHSEGAWVAMLAAAREKRVGAVALMAAPSTTGSELVLEQQRHVLDRLKTAEADKQAKIDLQKQINAAVLKGTGWDAVAPEIRQAADSPWFQSFLAFDPARVIRDVRQPILIVQGELDTQVAPYHAERLAELARARKRKAPVEVAKLAGVNHLMVAATTGEVDEYPNLPDKKIAPSVPAAITAWLTQSLQ